jgi:hypothetical protein
MLALVVQVAVQQSLAQGFGSGVCDAHEISTSPSKENTIHAGSVPPQLWCHFANFGCQAFVVMLNHVVLLAGEEFKKASDEHQDLADMLEDLDIVAQASPLAADAPAEQVCHAPYKLSPTVPCDLARLGQIAPSSAEGFLTGTQCPSSWRCPASDTIFR